MMHLYKLIPIDSTFGSKINISNIPNEYRKYIDCKVQETYDCERLVMKYEPEVTFMYATIGKSGCEVRVRLNGVLSSMWFDMETVEPYKVKKRVCHAKVTEIDWVYGYYYGISEAIFWDPADLFPYILDREKEVIKLFSEFERRYANGEPVFIHVR